jgi:hypothetical protein
MEVEDIDVNMFDTRVKVEGLWWHPASFMSYEVWRQQNCKPH